MRNLTVACKDGGMSRILGAIGTLGKEIREMFLLLSDHDAAAFQPSTMPGSVVYG
jgi:hypothetical protein